MDFTEFYVLRAGSCETTPDQVYTPEKSAERLQRYENHWSLMLE